MGVYELRQNFEGWKERAQAVLVVLSTDKIAEELAQAEAKMQAPDFWLNQNEAKRISQQVSALQRDLADARSLGEFIVQIPELISMAEADGSFLQDIEVELAKAESILRALELKTFFKDDLDQSNAIVSFHAGAGGVDAMDWAERLMRMYVRFTELKDWKVEVLDISQGEEAGVKSATLRIEGRYAYGMLKGEAGVHRLVRISPFDAEGMRHTSFAAVEVIPELSEVDEHAIEINPDDLRIDTFLSGGKGGQSVNTTYSAVRITHLPTGIVVSCQNERSQQQNRETAMNVLKSRLYQLMIQERAQKIDELRGVRQKIEWGSQIRSYVMQPYRLVKDHRTNVETADIDSVLNGDIQLFIEGYLRAQAEK